MGLMGGDVAARVVWTGRGAGAVAGVKRQSKHSIESLRL